MRDESTKSKQRLFVAIPLPGGWIKALCDFQRQNSHVKEVRWTQSQNLHVTVFFIGQVPAHVVPEIIQALGAVDKKPFRLQFQTICLAPSEKKARMIWVKFLQDSSFATLVGEIHCYLQKFAAESPFRKKPIPHITLARLRKPISSRELCQTEPLSLMEPVTVNSYELWESELLPQGASYKCVERFLFGEGH